jgi:AraC-like DNA-binding protein
MAVVVTLLPNQARFARVQAALRDRYRLIGCESWDAVRRACAEEPVSIVVLDPFGTGTGRFEDVRQLRLRYPSVSLVLYVSVPPTTGRDLFEAGRFGVDGLVLADVEDDPRQLRTFIEQAEARGVLGAVRQALDRVRPTVRDATLVAVTRAHQRLTPERLARVLGLRRKALAARLAAAGFPPPARLIAWGRLMVAARLLEDDRRSVDSVAMSLDYPSGSAFRNIFRRYLQATPQQVRAAGATRFVIDAFMRGVGRGSPSNGASPTVTASEPIPES